jgi:cytochrome c peroxidase
MSLVENKRLIFNRSRRFPFFIAAALLFAMGTLGYWATAEERMSQDEKKWKGVPGPDKYAPGTSPPAVVEDWQRDYLQYQPLGKGDTEQSPLNKPGAPNPPNIHRFGGTGSTSHVIPIIPPEPFEKEMKFEMEMKPKVTAQQQALLEQRYNLTPRYAPGVTMTRGKPIPMGPTARLHEGLTFEKLGAMSPEDIKAKDLFPYLPLPHPLHQTGGQVLPKMFVDVHPEFDRFDVAHDIPEAFLPEFPPPLFLTSRPDLGDVSQGQELTEGNFYELMKGILPPLQLEGLRILVQKFPEEEFNQTDQRKVVKPSRGIACLDCHVNGHTNGAFHLNPDNRPELARLRLDTPTLRGTNIQQILGSKRSLRSLEDFTEFENRSAYFNHELTTADRKGRTELTRNQVMAMAQFQNLVDFPPAPKLDVFGRLDPKKASQQELRGQAVFLGKARCAECHQPPLYTDNLMHDLRVERFYHGRAEGRIKTFPLRGIKDSPPYLHDGRLLTLEDAVEFFNLVTGVQLTQEEKKDLAAFLRAL